MSKQDDDISDIDAFAIAAIVAVIQLPDDEMRSRTRDMDIQGLSPTEVRVSYAYAIADAIAAERNRRQKGN